MKNKILLTSLVAMLSVGNAFAATTYLDTTALTNACKADPLSDSQVSAKAATITATWTPITYSIKFNKNGGSGTDMANQSMTYDVAANLTSNTYTKSGSVFRGWYEGATAGTTVTHTDGESVSNLSSTDGATVNLWAVWGACNFTAGDHSTKSSATTTGNACQYTVTCATGYHTNVTNGSTTLNGKTVTISSTSETSFVLTGPAGVYTGITMPACVSNSIALTWVGGYTGSTYSESNTCTYDGAITLPSTPPTRTGYTFDKWKVHD